LILRRENHPYKKSGRNTVKLINELLEKKEDGRPKLFLINQALKARKEKFPLFHKGAYVSVESDGKFKDHVISFARRGEGLWAITIAPRFLTSLMGEKELHLGDIWDDTQIILPEELSIPWKDSISNQTIQGGKTLLIADVFKYYPGALLMRGDIK
jgi:(1->4)-alpha-D-glucan 1-alpha-D-glucosylmutase